MKRVSVKRVTAKRDRKRMSGRGRWLLVLIGLLLPMGAGAQGLELSCEQKDNDEGGCCCFQKAHTYTFEPQPASQLEVTFDTGRGIGCRSQVAIEVRDRRGWQRLGTLDAISSNGRSQTHRLHEVFDLSTTPRGVRISDGGRCYIDYSKVELRSGSRPRDTGPPRNQLRSGKYRLEAFSNRRHTSLWDLEVEGGKVSGSSEWDCCPGRRRDALHGTVQDGRIEIRRNCSGQGLSGRCSQVYEGRVGRRGTVEGTWSHNGDFAGRWRLDPEQILEPEPPFSPASRIRVDPPPPYRQLPVTLEFELDSGPIEDAEWWMDGRRMTNADFFFWTFSQPGQHRIELRDGSKAPSDRQNPPIARYELHLHKPTSQRVEIFTDGKPPFHLPTSLTFRQQPRPVAGARWYVDDVYAASAETLTREFLKEGRYRITLQSSGGEKLATYVVQVESPAYRLWGRRRRTSSGGTSNDLREIRLERAAAITQVEGSAESYCIWALTDDGSLEQQMVCGNRLEPVVGAILLPGRYVVVPDLDPDQRTSEVTLHLKPRS